MKIPAITFLALALCSGCSDEPEDSLDHSVLIGSWKLERAIDGPIDEAMPDSPEFVIQFTEDAAFSGTVSRSRGKRVLSATYKYKLYRDGNPLALDRTDEEGNVLKEIFQIKGDQLTIVSPKRHDPSVPRPTKIVNPGDDYFSIVHGRIKE